MRDSSKQAAGEKRERERDAERRKEKRKTARGSTTEVGSWTSYREIVIRFPLTRLEDSPGAKTLGAR